MLAEKIQSLPEKPGVYLFKDPDQTTIYIGKAKNLKHRVGSYFQSSRKLDRKTKILKKFIHDLDYIVTDSELEALFLESNLVKTHKPKFNVHLKDDKAFLHIKLTINETYPRVLLTRKISQDGALYFGPFLPASLARNMIKIINRHFLLRTCDIEIDGNLERPCLEYFMKRCLGPCVKNLCTEQEYTRSVQDVVLFLQGNNQELINNLQKKMQHAADRQKYEVAAFHRDRIQMIQNLTKKQKVIQGKRDDVDIFAYYREGHRLALQLFTLRKGRIVGKREFFWEDIKFFQPAQFLRDALQQYYVDAAFIPQQIHLPVKIKDQELLNKWLGEKQLKNEKISRIKIMVPRQGPKYDLLLLVERNAKIAFETRFKILKSEKDKLLEQVKTEFDLPDIPKHIEAFDISNIQGKKSAASVVICKDGLMEKSQYRKLKIETVNGPDDYQSIYEAVYRRYKRRLTEQSPLPNFILIDGGKGQLHSAYQALSKLEIEDIPLASIAKRNEWIYIQDREDPVILPDHSPVLHLIQEIRNEAHRFALAYHRKLRSMHSFHSELERIPGIGEKRKKRLLRNFGSLAQIRKASIEELIPFVGKKLARTILERLINTDKNK